MHVPNFDFLTGCCEFKRCEESEKTVKLKRAQKFLACVARISMRFPSKEQGPMKNEASKRAGRGWGRKERNACRQTQGFWKPPNWRAMPECTHRHLMLSSTVIYWPIKRLASVERKWTFEEGGIEKSQWIWTINAGFVIAASKLNLLILYKLYFYSRSF